MAITGYNPKIYYNAASIILRKCWAGDGHRLFIYSHYCLFLVSLSRIAWVNLCYSWQGHIILQMRQWMCPGDIFLDLYQDIDELGSMWHWYPRDSLDLGPYNMRVTQWDQCLCHPGTASHHSRPSIILHQEEPRLHLTTIRSDMGVRISSWHLIAVRLLLASMWKTLQPSRNMPSLTTTNPLPNYQAERIGTTCHSHGVFLTKL